MELIGAEEEAGNKAQALLKSRLSALGAHVPVTLAKDRGVVKLRAVLSGPRAADLVYHLELQVFITCFYTFC